MLTLILSKLIPWFEKNFEFDKFKSDVTDAIFELIFFGYMYIITLFVIVPSILIVILFLVSLVWKMFFTYKQGDWIYFSALGILGPILEGTLVQLGSFRYAHTDILGIPYWLFLLWGNGGLLARRLFNLPQLKWKLI